MRLIAAGALVLAAGGAGWARPVANDAQLQAALRQGPAGERIDVLAGTYHGPLVINRSLELHGHDWPVLDGGGKGTVVTVNASDVTVQGFEIRGSGSEPEQDHAGVTLNQPRARVIGNRFREVLYGIFVARADDSLVEGNDVCSKPELELGRRGDGIRLWYSQRVTVTKNVSSHCRDLVAWYSKDVHFTHNTVSHGRYGLHFMYCDGARVTDNSIHDNSVGIYTMYSENLHIQNNRIAHCRGASGYALGFKDAGDVTVTNNTLSSNRVGIFLDSTPLRPGSFAHFEDNVLAFNDVGFALFPSVKGARFRANTVWENGEQMSLEGAGLQQGNDFSGNYWSDYEGCDLDGDGRGDLPYRSERLFEKLADHNPMLRYFANSPTQQALDLAARLFPLVSPQPKLEDPQPLVQPPVLPTRPARSSDPAHWVWLGGLVAAALGWPLLPAARVHFRKRGPMTELLRIENLKKSFGSNLVLQGLQLELQPGQAVALWGPNGAGKTTVIRCLLGLLTYEGSIRLGGFCARSQGKKARALLGYVPQELNFHDDLSVAETMDLYTRLRRTEPAQIREILELVGLAEVSARRVSDLSGGMRQRLALGLALLGDPPLLILDEPTSNLDIQGRDAFLKLLQQLRRRGKSLLFTTHRLEEVLALADRVVLLRAGQPSQVCAPSQLLVERGARQTMKLRLDPDRVLPAVELLARSGFEARPNGCGIWVNVAADAKATPIGTLVQAGIPVTDFDL